VNASAVDVVTDPILQTQTTVDEVQNYALQTRQYLTEFETYLNQAKSLLYQGNPGSLTSIPGVGDVALLASTAATLARDTRAQVYHLDGAVHQAEQGEVQKPVLSC
jgi:hypothetical protein